MIAFIFLFPFKTFAYQLSSQQATNASAVVLGEKLTIVGCMTYSSSYNYYFFFRPPQNASQIDQYMVLTYQNGGHDYYLGYYAVSLATRTGNRAVTPFASGWPVINDSFLPYLKADKNYLPSEKCSFSYQECSSSSLTNPNDMLCEHNYDGGSLTINGKRREY